MLNFHFQSRCTLLRKTEHGLFKQTPGNAFSLHTTLRRDSIFLNPRLAARPPVTPTQIAPKHSANMAEVNSTTSFPISLRPWAKEDSNAESLSDLIYRINIERKGFRHVSEDDLRREIEHAENEMVHEPDEESDEGTKEDEEKGTAKYIAKKRAELSYYLRWAHCFILSIFPANRFAARLR
jgi:hypothetical protein